MMKEDVLKDPVFLHLSLQQQDFVREILDGTDKVDAAFKAYVCKDRSSAQSIANRLMKKLSIQRLIGAFFDEDIADKIPTREELAAAAWERAQQAQEESDAHKWFVLVGRLLYDGPSDNATALQVSRSNKAAEELKAKLEARGL